MHGHIIMIHMGKHESRQIPPDLSYFGRLKTISDPSSSMSPGKRINLRSECMDQLNKWHGLLEKGAISQTQYDEFKKKIIGDIADL